MLRMIAKLLKVLNSETEPGQISLGFCFAMIAGLTPFASLHNILVILLVLFLRVNLSAFIVGLPVFTGLSYALDPVSHLLGRTLLTSDALEGLWTSLYNSTFFRLAHFNNTVLMGSLVLSLLLFVPLYLIANVLIRKYRRHFLSWIEKTRVMQMFKAGRIYHYYKTASGWRG